jgi:alpha,alpha-trehalase
VPNGGRIYYLERSQPPLLIPMIDLYYKHTQDRHFIQDNIAVMEKEHEFWLNNRSITVVGLSGRGHSVARYNVKRSQPRPEGYMTDVVTTKDMPGDQVIIMLLAIDFILNFL